MAADADKITRKYFLVCFLVCKSYLRPGRLILIKYLAERVGFEPTVRENRTPDFESGTFDHSATSPLEVVMVAESLQP